MHSCTQARLHAPDKGPQNHSVVQHFGIDINGDNWSRLSGFQALPMQAAHCHKHLIVIKVLQQDCQSIYQYKQAIPMGLPLQNHSIPLYHCFQGLVDPARALLDALVQEDCLHARLQARLQSRRVAWVACWGWAWHWGRLPGVGASGIASGALQGMCSSHSTTGPANPRGSFGKRVIL